MDLSRTIIHNPTIFETVSGRSWKLNLVGFKAFVLFLVVGFSFPGCAWMGGLSLPFVSAVLHSCQGLCCCHTSCLALGQQKVLVISWWPWVTVLVVSEAGAVQCCVVGWRAMDDRQLCLECARPACQGSGSRILVLAVSSSPYGSLASVRHDRALMQSSDFVGALFNPHPRSLMS